MRGRALRANVPGVSPQTPRVLIAGGGIAAVEALLALRALAEERVRIELVAPGRLFTVPAYSVGGPLGLGRTPRYDLEEIAAERGATVRRDVLSGVNAADHLALTNDGDELPYDHLLVAIGARARPAVAGALTFAGRRDQVKALRGVVNRVVAGRIGRIAFAIPEGPHWPLPGYELALMIGGAGGDDVRVSLVTPEEGPLEVFGAQATDAVRARLDDAGVELLTGVAPLEFADGVLRTSNGDVPCDVVVALARLDGPGVGGLRDDENGFLPTDPHGRVAGAADVYAAGDVTAYPIKHGGLAADQADAAAETIAAAVGAPISPQPFTPVLRGLLLTAKAPEYLRAELQDGRASRSTAATERLWWPASKITGRYLGPYLAPSHEVVVDAARKPGTGVLPVQARFEPSPRPHRR
jgi:sulfide:quinone oxidoreductase